MVFYNFKFAAKLLHDHGGAMQYLRRYPVDGRDAGARNEAKHCAMVWDLLQAKDYHAAFRHVTLRLAAIKEAQRNNFNWKLQHAILPTSDSGSLLSLEAQEIVYRRTERQSKIQRAGTASVKTTSRKETHQLNEADSESDQEAVQTHSESDPETPSESEPEEP